MTPYLIRSDDKGIAVERDGVKLGVFADRESAEQYVLAHSNFRKSVSGRFVSPAAILCGDNYGTAATSRH